MSNKEPMENHQQLQELNAARAARTTPITAPPSLAPAVLQKLGLGGVQTLAHVEQLRTALHSRDWFVRARAVRTLGQLGLLAPLELLLPALSDEHVSVRVTAVRALANFGPRVPVERLTAALHDEEWQVREAVVFALGGLGQYIPREALIVASHDADIAVRTAAMQVLQQDNTNTMIERGPMRQTDFQVNEHRPTRGEKLAVRTPRRSILWRRVGVSAAVVFVILNVVAWTAIVQHLRPSRTIMSVGSVQATATVKPLPLTPTLPPDETLYTFTCQDDGIHALAWSPDGKRLGSTCLDATSRDATTGNNIFRYEQSSSSVNSISWSPDGKRIQTPGQSTKVLNTGNQSVKVWDAATGRVLVEYQPQEHLSTAIVPSTHANPQAQANPQSGGNMIYSSSWSPDGKLIASSVDGGAYGYEVQIWNSQTGNLVYRLQPTANPTARDYINQVSWSPDGKYIALTVDGNVQVWNVATRSIVTKYPGGNFAWSPDSKDIVSTEDDGTVQVHVALSGKMVYTYNGHVGQPFGGASTVAWSPDGRRIASGGTDVQVWDATTGANAYVYKGHGNAQYTNIGAIVWSPDSKYIASGDSIGPYGGHVRVWVAK